MGLRFELTDTNEDMNYNSFNVWDEDVWMVRFTTTTRRTESRGSRRD